MPANTPHDAAAAEGLDGQALDRLEAWAVAGCPSICAADADDILRLITIVRRLRHALEERP